MFEALECTWHINFFRLWDIGKVVSIWGGSLESRVNWFYGEGHQHRLRYMTLSRTIHPTQHDFDISNRYMDSRSSARHDVFAHTSLHTITVPSIRTTTVELNTHAKEKETHARKMK
jgi:hypothetical protein